MTFHIITLFPSAFDSYLSESILSRAIEDKKIKVKFYNPRDFSDNKFKHIDQPPYSGGPGMVIQAMPVVKAVEKALKNIAKTKPGTRKISNFQFPISNKISNSKIPKNVRIIWLTPGGKQFDTETAKKLAKKYTDIIVICGRYEGIDARVKKIFKVEEISIGPYILTGGELPSEIIIDSISRQVPGVLGNFGSLEESRTGAQTASHDVYTRPEVIEHGGKKYRVPKVLLSGDHKKIEEWKNRKNSSK